MKAGACTTPELACSVSKIVQGENHKLINKSVRKITEFLICIAEKRWRVR